MRREDHYGGADAFHGAGGEWRVEKPRVRWDILEAFREAAARAGHPATTTTSTAATTSASATSRSTSGAACAGTRRRRSCDRRPSGRTCAVLTGARARAGARGPALHRLRARRRDARRAARAREEVILAAGAVDSPQLLELSGIGDPRSCSARAASTVVHPLPGVGENLQDHLQLRMAFKVDGRAHAQHAGGQPARQGGMALEYCVARSGPMSMAPSQLGAFARSSAEVAATRPRIPRAAAVARQVRRSAARVRRLHGVGVQPAPDLARQRAHRSADPEAAPPAIAPQLPVDRRGPHGRGQCVAADPPHRGRTRARAAIEPEEFLPGPRYQSDEELARAAGDIGTTIFHPVGTCKMGPAGDPGAWSTRSCACTASPDCA